MTLADKESKIQEEWDKVCAEFSRDEIRYAKLYLEYMEHSGIGKRIKIKQRLQWVKKFSCSRHSHQYKCIERLSDFERFLFQFALQELGPGKGPCGHEYSNHSIRGTQVNSYCRKQEKECIESGYSRNELHIPFIDFYKFLNDKFKL